MEFKTIDTASLDATGIRLLMGAVIGPRPIVLITTLGPGGVVNAAPYSNFMGVSSEPVLVAFAGGPKNGVLKDTIRNAIENGEFVVNTVSVDLAERMHATAADLPPDESEAEAAGLETLPSDAVGAPRLAASPIHLECRLERVVDLPAGHKIIIGEVLRVHVRADILREDGAISGTGWNPLGGVGDDYMRPGETFSLGVPADVLAALRGDA